MMSSLFKKPSAFLPFVMSFAALTLLAGYAVFFGIAQQQHKDEGIAARSFQLLMVGQLPIITYFAVKWLPQKTTEVLKILALQITTMFLVFLLIVVLEI